MPYSSVHRILFLVSKLTLKLIIYFRYSDVISFSVDIITLTIHVGSYYMVGTTVRAFIFSFNLTEML